MARQARNADERLVAEAARHVRTGRVTRSAPLMALASSTMLRSVPRWVGNWRAGEHDRLARDLEFHARSAEHYAALLGNMKGALMKAGQILSFVDTAGIVPEPYRAVYQQALEALQADAPPMDYATVSAVVSAELGAPPEEVFDRFSPHPIAAASIGQVHAARVGDRELAVKVQYPGVAEAIEADLDNTELMASVMRFGAKALPGFSTNVDFRVVAEEIRERIGEELDYERELANQAEFARHYEGHPFVRIPAVHPDLSTRRVLTMDMVDGRRFKAACESEQELRDHWGEVVLRFVFGSIHRFGLFNADPHPANYLFHEDGTVTFLDFGCVKRFTPEQLDQFVKGQLAALDADPVALHEHLVSLGSLPEPDAVDPERLLEWYRPAFAPILAPQPFTYTREWAASEVARQYDPFNEWKDVTRRFAIPKDLLFLARITIGLNSVLGLLGATVHCRAHAEELLRDAPPVTELGRSEAAWRETRNVA